MCIRDSYRTITKWNSDSLESWPEVSRDGRYIILNYTDNKYNPSRRTYRRLRLGCSAGECVAKWKNGSIPDSVSFHETDRVNFPYDMHAPPTGTMSMLDGSTIAFIDQGLLGEMLIRFKDHNGRSISRAFYFPEDMANLAIYSAALRNGAMYLLVARVDRGDVGTLVNWLPESLSIWKCPLSGSALSSGQLVCSVFESLLNTVAKAIQSDMPGDNASMQLQTNQHGSIDCNPAMLRLSGSGWTFLVAPDETVAAALIADGVSGCAAKYVITYRADRVDKQRPYWVRLPSPVARKLRLGLARKDLIVKPWAW